MNYIGLLTKEEKATLCEIITGREFKDLFKRNEQDFSKIQKGFRAKSLTEQHALSIAIANVDKPFIAMWVNLRVEHWLKEIKDNIVKLEEEGLTHGAALATTMLDSFFVNNIELYFKLAGAPLDADAYSHLYDRMKSIKSGREKFDEASNRIKALETENQRLSDQIAENEHNIDTIKAENEGTVRKLEQDKNELEAMLSEAQAKIAELQTAPNTFTNDDADYLAQFDDTNASTLPSDSTNETISLCSIISDYSGQKWLIRYADLDGNGRYHIFHRNENLPPYFENRDKLFYKDGPSNDGFYGIWNWSTIPNENDPSKDYVRSRYNPKIDAIEIVAITQATNLDELASLLKEGIEYHPTSQRVMFSIPSSKESYIGLLCTTKELHTVNGKTNLSEDCTALPVYEFTSDYIMRFDNKVAFYRTAFAGIPSKLYHLKSPLDIVKDVVSSSLSWNIYKARATRTEFRAFKDFIGAIPVDDIISKIEIACRCSNPAAKELLNNFLNIAWQYINGESLEDEIVCSAISAMPELQEKAKALIRREWEEENESLLDETHRKLDLLQKELENATENLSRAQEALNKTKAEEEQLSCIINEKKKLASDVEEKVAERIQKARENVADFISNMAFVSGQQAGKVVPSLDDTMPEPDIDTYSVHSEFESLDELEAHHSWEDVINTAIYELTEAGVAEQYRSGLAAFLCAAYIEKQPLLLVGPNAIDIAQAFCAAVTAHKYGALYCEGNCVRHTIKKIGSDGEDIVIINNLLAGGWINRLPEILSQKDIFYIATHPYAEDIQVEPKSLYSFMLPLFTEVLVDKKASGKYYGGYFADDFEPYSAEKDSHKELTVLSIFGLSSLVRGKLNSLLTTMHSISPSVTADDDFLFFVFPIAYASMAVNELAEIVSDPQKGIGISANLRRNLQCMLGEN